ncbi:hypothetical protein CEF21_17880 [Bacillus sp. FJAT-42376]|uniref:hypothetical protein n=1 Tax=Bacillus sp. FJAT-42376 TaxID=2014076 RepID=UPI000F4D31A6|nr:hypothetical protein [Bacillus sp. FJAT-42376]AZB44033.1 hypothetical protein CEF21_17880 [Bacillus sp. FJAT-42376]
MFAVHFIEDKNIVLSQLLTAVPAAGDDLKIKGRKGQVAEVRSVDDRNVNVYVVFESVVKNKAAADDKKKKKR